MNKKVADKRKVAFKYICKNSFISSCASAHSNQSHCSRLISSTAFNDSVTSQRKHALVRLRKYRLIWEYAAYIYPKKPCCTLKSGLFIATLTSLCNVYPMFPITYEPAHDKMACAPSKDSDQPAHPPSPIRVFAVHMKKAWVLSYALST